MKQRKKQKREQKNEVQNMNNDLLIIVYLVLGYWATGRTIYRNRILMGTANGIFLHRVIIGALLGFILIPLAVLSLIFQK